MKSWSIFKVVPFFPFMVCVLILSALVHFLLWDGARNKITNVVIARDVTCMVQGIDLDHGYVGLALNCNGNHIVLNDSRLMYQILKIHADVLLCGKLYQDGDLRDCKEPG